MPNASTGTLRAKILELSHRTGETPAEALEMAIQEKLSRLRGEELASLEPDPELFERIYGGLSEAEDLYE